MQSNKTCKLVDSDLSITQKCLFSRVQTFCQNVHFPYPTMVAGNNIAPLPTTKAPLHNLLKTLPPPKDYFFR